MDNTEKELRKELLDLRIELAHYKRENEVLRGESDDLSWLMMKVDSQRRALDRLNRKVSSQRFYLRILESFGRGLTREEYVAKRDELEDEGYKDRLEYELVG